MATNSINAPNVWSQMNYVPPRGQCNYRQSMLSPKCPCLRFMLHPLKSSSSYECDGCTHHASFHTMENKAEDEIRKRWEQEAKDRARQSENDEDARPRKRIREIEQDYQSESELRKMFKKDGDLARVLDAFEHGPRVRVTTKGKGKKESAAGSSGSGRATRTKGKVQEILDDEDGYIELD